MNITRPLLGFIVAASLAALLAGCGKTQEATSQAATSPTVASPDCASLASMTDAQKADPALQAELLKKCPRSGPAFKASPKKDY